MKPVGSPASSTPCFYFRDAQQIECCAAEHKQPVDLRQSSQFAFFSGPTCFSHPNGFSTNHACSDSFRNRRVERCVCQSRFSSGPRDVSRIWLAVPIKDWRNELHVGRWPETQDSHSRRLLWAEQAHPAALDRKPLPLAATQQECAGSRFYDNQEPSPTHEKARAGARFRSGQTQFVACVVKSVSY